MALVLYDIFWSHFCEKARFCLDYKGLPHTIVPVNPFTRREVIGLGMRGDVPVLKDGARVIAGSGAIASHLEETHADPPLLPREARAREAVLALQTKCDERLGPDARRVAYEVALENPALLVGTILWARPPKRWLNPLVLRLVDPRVRRKFKIFPRELQESRERLRRLLGELQAAIVPTGFLVGDRMTRLSPPSGRGDLTGPRGCHRPPGTRWSASSFLVPGLRAPPPGAPAAGPAASASTRRNVSARAEVPMAPPGAGPYIDARRALPEVCPAAGAGNVWDDGASGWPESAAPQRGSAAARDPGAPSAPRWSPGSVFFSDCSAPSSS